MPVRGDGQQQQQQLLCRKLNARPCASCVCLWRLAPSFLQYIVIRGIGLKKKREARNALYAIHLADYSAVS